MKIHRTSVILKKCQNRKFKKGFILYLSSLEFKEFKELYDHYTTVIAKMLIKYEDKPKFFSKAYFIKDLLNYHFDKIYNMFSAANYPFVNKINIDLSNNNKRKDQLLIDIKEKQKILENLSTLQFTIYQMPTNEEIIKFSIVIIENLSINNELNNMINELKQL